VLEVTFKTLPETVDTGITSEPEKTN